VGSFTVVNILGSQKCARVIDVPQTWFINWPDDGCMSRNIYENSQQDALYRLTLRLLMSYIYIYIYDISSLRVNDLTLILLTWRKW